MIGKAAVHGCGVAQTTSVRRCARCRLRIRRNSMRRASKVILPSPPGWSASTRQLMSSQENRRFPTDAGDWRHLQDRGRRARPRCLDLPWP